MALADTLQNLQPLNAYFGASNNGYCFRNIGSVTGVISISQKGSYGL